jgi:hypothetical protein
MKRRARDEHHIDVGEAARAQRIRAQGPGSGSNRRKNNNLFVNIAKVCRGV